MDKITLSDLIQKISELSGAHPKRTVREILDATAEAIKIYAKNGRAVPFPGLGTFKLADRAAKTGRNPKTGEAIQIPAKLVLTFKPSRTVDFGAE